MRLFVTACLLLAALFCAQTAKAADTLDYYVAYQQLLDNREYKMAVGNPQSIMASRLDFALGIKRDTTQGLYVGLNYMYEYGSTADALMPRLNLYYYIKKDHLSIYTGSFSRSMFAALPRILMSDSLRYYRPNIEGMALHAHGSGWSQTLMADWTGRRSRTRRESFVLSITGKVQREHWYLENHAYMYHLGFRDGKPYGEYIRDNGMGLLFLGYDAAHLTPLDDLTFDLGLVGNYDRERPDDYHFYGGVTARLQAWYQRVGIEAFHYYGHRLHNPLGNPLFRNGPYTRIDLCCIPLKGARVESMFKWGFHLSKGIMSNSQLFTFTVGF